MQLLIEHGSNESCKGLAVLLLLYSTPDIAMLGEDPEEWESSGMPIDEDKIGKMFQVEVIESDKNVKTIWREVVGTPPTKRGERFYLSGSFNAWGMEPMEASFDIPNLHSAEITVGNMGEELFYIICDEDPNMVYFPTMARCQRKTIPIAGPEPVGGDPEDSSWSITGQPGSRYRVEFYLAETSVSVMWVRCRNAISS